MYDGDQPGINPELNSWVEDAPVPRTYCWHQQAGHDPEPKEPTMIFLIRRLIRLFKQRKQQQGN